MMEPGYSYVWEFLVPSATQAEYERAYGADGPWVALFRRAPGYLGTLLLKDRAREGRYLTVDRWRSEADYRAFRQQFAQEYAELDRACEHLTAGETSLGEFSE